MKCIDCSYLISCKYANENIKYCEFFERMKRMEVENYGKRIDNSLQNDRLHKEFII